MDDQLHKTGEGQTIVPTDPAKVALADKPIEDLEKDLATALDSKQGETPAPSESPSSPELKPTPASPETVPVEQAAVKETPQQPEAAKPVEAKPQGAFDELQKKTGIKDPNSLADSYTALVRELHAKSQELAALKKTAPEPAYTPAPQAQPMNDDESFRESLANDPRGTLARAHLEMNKITLAPFFEKQAELERQLQFQRLSSSPDTPDFADPTIQEEMIRVYKDRPEWCATQAEINKHTEDAYWIARGKTKTAAEQKAFQEGQARSAESLAQKKAAMVEGSSVPQKTQPFDPRTGDLATLQGMLVEALKNKSIG